MSRLQAIYANYGRITMTSEYIGIDYGNGLTNLDLTNGIRYGVIPQSEVLQAWSDESEGDYGDATCPKCGNDGLDTDSEKDFTCWTCEYSFYTDEAYGDEPLGYSLNKDGYIASSDSVGDIFITKSPYYTYAKFCSPCAPGAGYLMNPCEDGPKVYCFGHDWFPTGKAPYRVFRVDTNEEVLCQEK